MMCRLASLLGLLLLLLPVATSVHNSVPQSARRNIGKSRKGGYVGARPRRRKSLLVNDVDVLRSDSSDEFDANGLAKTANDVMNLYASTRDISFVNQTVADWPGICILPAETPSELFAIEYTSRIGSVAFYSVYEVEVEGSTQLHWSPSMILPASCYNCLGATLHSSSQRDITDFAEELIFRLRETKETFGEPPPTTQALEEAVKRVARLVRRPEHVLVTDGNETILDYPSFVREAAIAQYVTNSTGIIEKVDVPDNVSIHIRNPKNVSAGSWCIFVQEHEDGNFTEYHLRPCEAPFDFQATQIHQVERQLFPIQWKYMVPGRELFPLRWKYFLLPNLITSHSFHLLLAMIGSYACDIPNCGFSTSFENNFSSAVNLFSGIAGVALVVVNFVVAVVKHNTDDNGTSTGKLIFKDQDWLEEHSKDYRAAWYRYLQLWGNKKRGRLQKNWWLLVQYFIPAVAEEWLFRGFLQTLLSRYIGIGRAITIQAILFGLLHYGYKSKWHMTACAASGLWYGWLFEQTGNLPLVILMHFLKNSTTGFKCGQVVRCLLQYELRHLYELVAGPNEEQEGANEK